MYGSVVEKNAKGESVASSAELPLLPARTASTRRRSTSTRRLSAAGRGLDRSKPSSRLVVKQKSKPVLTNLFDEQTQSSESQLHHEHHHSHVYTVLNPRSSQPQAVLFKRVMSTTIILNVLCFIISTEPNLPEWTQDVFKLTEGVTSSIFLIEYLARLITCTERHKYGNYGPILGRLRFMIQPSSLIDAFATFPFFLERLTGIDLPTLTYLRVFRLLRILKTQGYARAMDAVYRVVYYNREILWVALLLCIFLVLVTSVLLYYLRPHNPEDAEDFTSIPATMYLSILMLTGQGGPNGDLPWYTKGIVVLTAVFSVAMFAIPASMLTWGFEAEAARLAARARRRSKRHAELGSDCSSSSSYTDDSSSADTTDEEYQKIIAGEEDTDDDEDGAMKKLVEEFKKGDADGSGALTMAEFVKMGMVAPAVAMGKAPRFSNAAAAATAGESWQDRMDELESKVNATNKKLDKILQLLKDKNM